MAGAAASQEEAPAMKLTAGVEQALQTVRVVLADLLLMLKAAVECGNVLRTSLLSVMSDLPKDHCSGKPD